MKLCISKLIFKLIYKTYLLLSKSNTGFGISERIVEYPFVIKNLNLSKNSKILVVGCASDPLTTILAALGYNIVGLDIKFLPIRFPNFEFVQSDIRKTDFQDKTFDAIVAVSTIEHVGVFDEDRCGDKKAFSEMIRILKQKGILFMTLPYGAKAEFIRYNQRIYDHDTLKELINCNIETEKMEIYSKDKEGYWNLIQQKEIDVKKEEAVILLKIRKG